MASGESQPFAISRRDLLAELFEHFDSSLREIERCLTNIAIVANATSGNVNSDYADIVAIVSVLKVTRPSLYSKLRINKASYKEILKETGFDMLQDLGWAERVEGSYIRFLLKYCVSGQEVRKAMSEETRDYFRGEFGRREFPIMIVCGWLDAFDRH